MGERGGREGARQRKTWSGHGVLARDSIWRDKTLAAANEQ